MIANVAGFEKYQLLPVSPGRMRSRPHVGFQIPWQQLHLLEQSRKAADMAIQERNGRLCTAMK